MFELSPLYCKILKLCKPSKLKHNNVIIMSSPLRMDSTNHVIILDLAIITML